jgi:hypothetical protein
MSSINIYPDKCKIKGCIPKVILEVEYDYTYEEGQNPTEYNETGTPPSGGLEITSIWCSGDLHDLLCNYTTTKEIIDEIEKKICNYERNCN